MYGTQYFSGRKIGLDYYAVNFHSKLRKYNYQAGLENRQTFGLRLFSNLQKLILKQKALINLANSTI